MKRTDVIIAAGIGLLLNMLTVLAGIIIRRLWLPALLPQAIAAWMMFILFGGFSLLEIPVMIYGLRKMTAEGKPTTIKVALFIAGVFVFFAAVYALPNLLLTSPHTLWMGVVLAGIGLLRFATAVLFLGE